MSEQHITTPPPPEDVSKVIFGDLNKEESEKQSVEKTNVNPERYYDEIDYLLLDQLNSSLTQNRGERIKYAKWTFYLTVFWIIVVLGIVFLSGFRIRCEKVLVIPDAVLITLITTTTLNVFGFFLLVMQFLFNKEELKALGYLKKKKKEKAIPKQDTK